MPYTYTITPADKCFTIVLSGIMHSADDLTQFTHTLISEAKQLQCWRVLVDERTVDRTIDQYEVRLFAEQWIMENPRNGMKMAAVYSETDAAKYHWVETILQNRSLIYKIFSDMAEAEAWLLS